MMQSLRDHRSGPRHARNADARRGESRARCGPSSSARCREVITYNTTKKRLDDGSRRRRQRRKPETEWVKIDAPQLRLIEPELAERVDDRLQVRRHAYLRTTNGRLLGRPAEGKRLLSGFLVCECGARFEAVRNWGGSRTRMSAPHAAARGRTYARVKSRSGWRRSSRRS